MIQTVHEDVAMFLVHAEASCVILLQRIILQIHRNEEKTFLHTGQRTVLIDAKTPLIGCDACRPSHIRKDNHHVLLQNKEATTGIGSE
jgi:hypothetical protein